MVKHNNQIVNNHFRKAWDRRVRTWFNQPGRKLRRREQREKKMKEIFPRPASGLLRPVVQCCTKRYSSKARLGRGFTLEELKAAGLNKRIARGLGVSVDHRRNDRNKETFARNVDRIKAFRSKQVIFPTNTVTKASLKEKKAARLQRREILSNIASATQVRDAQAFNPRAARSLEEPRAITEDERKASVFVTLRKAKMSVKRAGDAVKKANAKEKEIQQGGGKKAEGGDA